MGKSYPLGLDPHQTEFVKLVRANADRYRQHEVFRDFCELAALSLSNAVDRVNYDRREARYLDIIKRYREPEVARFPAMLANLVMSLESTMKDCIGQLFMGMELGSHWNGQFFTPYEVCRMMAAITLTGVRESIERYGYASVNEPAVGAGAMVIACAHTLRDDAINYQQAMHVYAQDIDATAVHMSYIQFSLLHIPALVIHGNSLEMSQWDAWATPAHILGGWDYKLQRREGIADGEAAGTVPAAVPAEMDRVQVVERRKEQAAQLGLFG